MKSYSLSEINLIKQQIRTGKPMSLIADDLAKEWNRPIGGVYSKVWKLSKKTKKITGEYTGPTRRPFTRKIRPAIASQIPPTLWNLNDKEEVILKEICEEIVNKEEEPIVEQQPADIGIEVPVSSISFTGIPSRVVIYPDHVRYYYNN